MKISYGVFFGGMVLFCLRGMSPNSQEVPKELRRQRSLTQVVAAAGGTAQRLIASGSGKLHRNPSSRSLDALPALESSLEDLGAAKKTPKSTCRVLTALNFAGFPEVKAGVAEIKDNVGAVNTNFVAFGGLIEANQKKMDQLIRENAEICALLRHQRTIAASFVALVALYQMFCYIY
jgi:hypothetical protein